MALLHLLRKEATQAGSKCNAFSGINSLNTLIYNFLIKKITSVFAKYLYKMRIPVHLRKT
jgi:hypothetical protein